MTLTLLFGALVLVQADDNKADREKLQGDWTVVVAMTRDGGAEFVGTRVRIAGDRLETFNKTGESEGVFTIVLNPKRSPKEIDLNATRNGKTITLRGIYSLEGKQVRLSWSSNREASRRPADFKAVGGDDIRSFVLSPTQK